MLLQLLLRWAYARPLVDEKCGIQRFNQTCSNDLQCCNQDGLCNNLPETCGINCDLTLDQDTCFTKHNYSISDREVGAADVQQCGPEFGSCPEGSCCNFEGLCGSGDVDCDLIQGCQSDFGQCLPLDYQCGPQFGDQLCNVRGWCCGSIGFCGLGDFYCDFFQGCQSNCTNSPKPVPPATSTSVSSSTSSMVITSTTTTSSSTTSTSSSTSSSSSTSTSTTVELETTTLYYTSTYAIPIVITQTLTQPPLETTVAYYTSVVPISYEYTATVDAPKTQVKYFTTVRPISFVYTQTV